MIRIVCALALIALVAACAVGGPLEVPEQGTYPVRATQTVSAVNGEKLALSHWAGAAAGPVVLAVHGYGDYGPSTFAAAGQYWSRMGITTYAYDQRGFGRNRSRGLWPGADALAEDLIAIAAELKSRHPCNPFFVVGHSMGGGVTLAAAGAGLDADGIVLAAPAIWGGAKLNPLHRTAAWLAASLVPERRFSGRGLVSIQATDNIDALRALQRDTLYLSPPSARELFGLVRVTDRAAAAASKVTSPALLLLGEKDQIVKNDLVEEVFDRAKGPKEVIRYEEGWHLLFRDLQAEQVWEDVSDWVLSTPVGSRQIKTAGCG